MGWVTESMTIWRYVLALSEAHRRADSSRQLPLTPAAHQGDQVVEFCLVDRKLVGAVPHKAGGLGSPLRLMKSSKRFRKTYMWSSSASAKSKASSASSRVTA